MDVKYLNERIRIEEEILSHVTEALRSALDAEIRPASTADWLERTTFLLSSFQRHVVRLMDIKHASGYLDFVVEQEPTLDCSVQRIAAERDSFRVELDQLLKTIRGMRETNIENLFEIRQQILGFLVRLQKHRERETSLWIESVCVDTGGEG